MNKPDKINFALCWHMHQPWYREGLDGPYRQPWVYLHAIKDYDDMAAHLEAHPAMPVVVNFSPVLLLQLDDYANQLSRWLDDHSPMADPLLNYLAGVTDIPHEVELRYELVKSCRRANEEKMIRPYAAYHQLLAPLNAYMDMDDPAAAHTTLSYLNKQYFIDLLVWYHLAWLGHALKQTLVAQRLIKKARHYNRKDRRDLITLIRDSVASIIPRYRRLAQRGQIELSMTPWGHPIIPLLNNIDNMDCAQADAPRPDSHYPKGEERSRWHIQQALDCFEHYFGLKPAGVWLSEGAISTDSLALLDDYGFRWTASGEGVWRNSCRLSGYDDEMIHNKRALFHSWKLNESETKIFFRDDGLSDLIGFDYSKRDSVEAAEDLVQNLVNIANFLGDSAHRHIVTIILDGENAWEYYPHNGHYFLEHLYQRLATHERIRAGRLQDFTGEAMCHVMDRLCAGSWVYGSFSTWIGQKDKNLGWQLLIEAKQAFDRVMAQNSLDEDQRRRAEQQLAICESSDWFWWFGDYNSADSVSDFDRLYRSQLKQLYRMLHLPAPAALDTPVSVGGGQAENAGTMRRHNEDRV